MQLYEILQHILNHHSEEEWEKNDFFFMVRMIDSLYDYEDDPPILCDTIKKYMNRLYNILLRYGLEVKEFKNLNSYKNIQWTQLTDDIVEYMLPMIQKEFDSLYNSSI